MTTQPLVLGVFRIDTHGRIAHDGLRTCGSHHSIIALGILVDDITFFFQRINGHFTTNGLQVLRVSHIIFQVEEVALLVTIDDLLCRKHGLCLWIPIDHAETTIDESLLVEVNEDFEHTFTTLLIHRESSSIPIAGCTQTAQLLEDDASVFVCPSPSMLQELLTSEVALLDALFCQTIHHLCLRSNGSVVCARHPTSILAVDTSLTNENVLNGVVEHVAHVKHTRHVWWGNHNRV